MSQLLDRTNKEKCSNLKMKSLLFILLINNILLQHRQNSQYQCLVWGSHPEPQSQCECVCVCWRQWGHCFKQSDSAETRQQSSPPGLCVLGDHFTSSPKLLAELFHRGLSLVRSGLGPLQDVPELLQLLQRVCQLAPHGLQLPLQGLDPLDADELVGLAAVQRLLQVHHWEEDERVRERSGRTASALGFVETAKKRKPLERLTHPCWSCCRAGPSAAAGSPPGRPAGRP